MRPPNDAEPGTGEEAVVVASPPDIDDDNPCVAWINCRKWKVGHDYIDVEIGDVAYLDAIVRRSSWCDTRPPEDCPMELCFHYERYGEGLVRIDPNDPDFDPHERFVERYTKPVTGPGAPELPWK